MRGGAIPLLAWGALNLTLLVINWIWEGTGIHIGEFGFAVLVMWVAGSVFVLISRPAIRRGAPEAIEQAQPVPAGSVAAAVLGIGVGVILFGVVFGQFLLFIGGAIVVFALGRLTRELRWQRRTLAEVRRDGER